MAIIDQGHRKPRLGDVPDWHKAPPKWTPLDAPGPPRGVLRYPEPSPIHSEVPDGLRILELSKERRADRHVPSDGRVPGISPRAWSQPQRRAVPRVASRPMTSPDDETPEVESGSSSPNDAMGRIARARARAQEAKQAGAGLLEREQTGRGGFESLSRPTTAIVDSPAACWREVWRFGSFSGCCRSLWWP